ncbi:tRNA-dihydrouridine(16/17) synthase [NAD(P)(+)]-like protein, partial [Saguinus oedipus]
MPKLQGSEFWSHTLLGAGHLVAPMVDQSELAWRLLSRRHGAQLCYTPMLHSQVFVCDANYQKENLYCEVCPEDRPLIVQFCANDLEVFAQVALLAQNHCDAIGLNLGCPQMIAKRGHYGAFLQDEWNLLQRIILLAHEKLSVPVMCKICVFPEIDKTVRAPAVWKLAEEYLDIVREHPCPLSYVRAHLFKLWHHTLQVHQQLREELAKAKTLEGIAAVSQELKMWCQEEISRQEGAKPAGDLLFHWICHPYEGSKEKACGCSKQALEEEECGTKFLSKDKQKKQLRNPHQIFDPSLKPKYAKCDQCGNPKGNRCVFSLCRGCCKRRATKETADCPGHGLLFKTKLEKSLAWKGTQPELQEPQMATPCTPGGFSEVM